MNYSEKTNLASFTTTLLVSIPYFIYILGLDSSSALGASNEVEFWARALLLVIPIRIVVEIIVHILFSIFQTIITGNENVDETIDERDKLIELKAQRNAFYMFTFVIMAILGLLAVGVETQIAIITFIVGGFIVEITEYVSKFYMHKR